MSLFFSNRKKNIAYIAKSKEEMFKLQNYKLKKYEHKLVEKVFKERGTIFVEPDVTLREVDGKDFDLISSKWFEDVNVFKQAVETAKLIVYIRGVNVNELI